ncbi:hypothetical protein Trydic_g10223 [Trypoxylus dichotomus]
MKSLLLGITALCLNVVIAKNSLANLKITKLEMCDPSVDYPLKFSNTIKTDDGKQYLSGKAEFKVDFGADSDYNITIKAKKTKDAADFSPMVNFYEEDTCAALQKYLGKFFEDLETSVGIEAGKCPVEKVV